MIEEGVVYCDLSVTPKESTSSPGGSYLNTTESVGSTSDGVLENQDTKAMRANNVCPSVCDVCGEKASGYHYEVASCNGCKTFFRRSIVSRRKYVCKFTSNCHEQWPTGRRKLCRACRLEKCLRVGMNPGAVRKPQSPCGMTQLVRGKREVALAERAETTVAKLSLHLRSEDEHLTRVIEQLMYLEVKSEMFRMSAHNPNPRELPPLEVLVEQQSTLYMADRLGPMPNWPIDHNHGRGWDKDGGRKQWLSFDLLGTLEYAKTFGFFHKISRKDKVLLMKSVSLMCVNLVQAFFSYSHQSDWITHPDGTCLPRPSEQAGEIGTRSAMAKKETIAPLIRNRITRTEYVLIKAIIICNASVPDLSPLAVKVLTTEKQKMSNILCTYCLAHFGEAGPARYAANLALIARLEHLAKFQKDYHLLMSIKCPKVFSIKFLEELLH